MLLARRGEDPVAGAGHGGRLPSQAIARVGDGVGLVYWRKAGLGPVVGPDLLQRLLRVLLLLAVGVADCAWQHRRPLPSLDEVWVAADLRLNKKVGVHVLLRVHGPSRPPSSIHYELLLLWVLLAARSQLGVLALRQVKEAALGG